MTQQLAGERFVGQRTPAPRQPIRHYSAVRVRPHLHQHVADHVVVGGGDAAGGGTEACYGTSELHSAVRGHHSAVRVRYSAQLEPIASHLPGREIHSFARTPCGGGGTAAEETRGETQRRNAAQQKQRSKIRAKKAPPTRLRRRAAGGRTLTAL